MHACLLIELGNLLIGVLIAFDDVPWQQVAFEVVKGHSALLALFYLGNIKLELLHTVYL